MAGGKVDTTSVNYLILARRELFEATATASYRQLFAVRETNTRRVAGAAHITEPEQGKKRSVSAAVINGTERTFWTSTVTISY